LEGRHQRKKKKTGNKRLWESYQENNVAGVREGMLVECGIRDQQEGKKRRKVERLYGRKRTHGQGSRGQVGAKRMTLSEMGARKNYMHRGISDSAKKTERPEGNQRQ